MTLSHSPHTKQTVSREQKTYAKKITFTISHMNFGLIQLSCTLYYIFLI